MIHLEKQKIKVDRTRSLSATFYSSGQEIKGAVLIVPAMGVSQRYYTPLAEWLALQGYLACTFDYFGVGLSQAGSLRNTHTTVTDWATLDCSAMIEAISSKVKGRPVIWLGHSLGGQIFGLTPNREQISLAVTVASGSGYWLENAWSLRLRAWWLWYIVVPLATRLYGYFPGKRLRKVGNLPKGVIEQWRKWCLHPEYIVGIEGQEVKKQYSAVNTPIVSFSFADDEFMSKKNIDSLHGFYTDSPKTMHRFDPENLGSAKIGHFGFFKSKFKHLLWESKLLPALDGVTKF